MLQFQVIGNLGADARLETYQGRQFVSFNVGHNERFTDADGHVRESTMWVSCAWNGDGGKLLQYLKKGRCVFVSGRGSARAYSSQKARGFVAGLNISVERVELVGAQPDEVPRQLYAEGGILYKPTKFFSLSVEELKDLKIGRGEVKTLWSLDRRAFLVNDLGQVVPAVPEENKQPAGEPAPDEGAESQLPF